MKVNHHQQTAVAIKQCLLEKFQPAYLEVINNSHLHAKHKGALENPDKGHFHIIIDASSIKSTSNNMLMKHRAIYDALSDIMQRIHACEISLR